MGDGEERGRFEQLVATFYSISQFATSFESYRRFALHTWSIVKMKDFSVVSILSHEIESCVMANSRKPCLIKLITKWNLRNAKEILEKCCCDTWARCGGAGGATLAPGHWPPRKIIAVNIMIIMITIVNIIIIMIILVNIMSTMIILVNIMTNIDRSSSMLLTTMMLMLTTAQDHHRCCRRHSHHLDVDHRSQHHDLLSTGSILSTALDHCQCCFCGPLQDHPIQQNDPQDHHRKHHDQQYQDNANVGNNTKLMPLLTISSWHSGQYWSCWRQYDNLYINIYVNMKIYT